MPSSPAPTDRPANRYQEKFGTPSGRAATKVVDHLDDYVRRFIGHAPFAVMATANAEGGCDASPKGGRPGFVKVLDERHLLLPDVRGNQLFQSYENVDANPNVGLILGPDVLTAVGSRTDREEPGRAAGAAVGAGAAPTLAYVGEPHRAPCREGPHRRIIQGDAPASPARVTTRHRGFDR